MKTEKIPNAVTVGLAFCELSGWEATFQPSKGRLFLAQALHLARHGETLVVDGFMATDYGPEALAWRKYHQAYGAKAIRRPIQLPFLRPIPYGLALLEGARRETVLEIHEATKNWTPARFVHVTHAEDTPWARAYVPGLEIPILRKAMKDYGRAALLGQGQETAQQAA